MLTERQINTFKTAVDAQFGTDAIADRESATPTPAEPVEPEPTAPIAPSAPTAPDVEPTIDVEVKVADATVTDEPIELTAKATPPDIEGMLNKMTMPVYPQVSCELPERTGKGHGRQSQRG